MTSNSRNVSIILRLISYFTFSCQFVVREGENYDVHLYDADTLVDWNLIEQVVLKTTADVPSCPIW